ncbi:hypothetical protein DER45DRAFT_574668 [Fusarium avenaceum]|nr:hypothetical protein DER45DRAFT_574668 [Fusarium avenaceum]
MNALFNFLSSPLKQPAERPPPPTMPLTASKSKTYSPRERQRLNKRALDRYTEPEGRSPRSRLSNVSSAPSAHDTTTGDISIVSRTRRSTITMAPPSEKKTKRTSTSSAQSSPAAKLSAAAVLRDVEELMASRRRSSRKEASPELGSSPPPTFDTPPAVAASRSTPRSRLSQVSRRASHSSSYATATPAKANRKQKQVENDEAQQEQQEQQQEQEQEEQVADQDEAEQIGQNEEEDDDKQHVFKRIMDHRWNGDKIQLRVEWQDGERTWTPEEIFHEDNLPALLAYWRTRKDGRPMNPRDPGVYQVFAIRKHRTHQGVKQVFVEWVGYDKSEWTWESQDDIESAAPEHIDAYFEKLKNKIDTKSTSKGTSKVVAKKGTAKKVTKSRAKATATTKDPLTRTRGRSRVTKS